jgi:hypothetical protein
MKFALSKIFEKINERKRVLIFSSTLRARENKGNIYNERESNK